jgi:DME family drug/metabolite transporter
MTRTRAASGTGLIMIATAAVLWGTVGVATRAIYTLASTNALSIGFFRLALATPALLVCAWLFCGRAMFQVARRDYWLILLVGAVTALYQVCLFSAIQFIGVSIAVVITLCVAPVIVALASTWLFGERLTVWVVAALICALVGTLLLALSGNVRVSASESTLIGILLALGSASGYATITLCSRILAPRYHPLQTISFGFSAGALMLLPFALMQGLVLVYPVEGWALLIHLALLPTALAYVLFLFGMRSVTATTASIVTLVEPLTAAVLSWLMFDEQLRGQAFIGGVLLCGAILLLYNGELRRAIKQ